MSFVNCLSECSELAGLEEGRHVLVDGLGGVARAVALDSLAFLVDEELGEVPLQAGQR